MRLKYIQTSFFLLFYILSYSQGLDKDIKLEFSRQITANLFNDSLKENPIEDQENYATHNNDTLIWYVKLNYQDEFKDLKDDKRLKTKVRVGLILMKLKVDYYIKDKERLKNSFISTGFNYFYISTYIQDDDGKSLTVSSLFSKDELLKFPPFISDLDFANYIFANNKLNVN